MKKNNGFGHFQNGGNFMDGTQSINIDGFAKVHLGDNLHLNTPSSVFTREEQCHRSFKTTDYVSFKDDSNPRRTSGTCEWAFQHPNFTGWRSSARNGVL